MNINMGMVFCLVLSKRIHGVNILLETIKLICFNYLLNMLKIYSVTRIFSNTKGYIIPVKKTTV